MKGEERSMKKIILSLVSAAFVLMLAACGAPTATAPAENAAANAGESAAVQDAPMSYVSPDDLKATLAQPDASEKVVVLDVRKAEDFEKDAIDGAIGADMDAAKAGDMESGKANMQGALEQAGLYKDGQLVESDKELVLVCYSGKSYAQAATNVLNEIGYDMNNVKTLEGGMKAW
ncbi:MAG: rhodanese-like domain-containing protein [Coriobacteriia bacterium]|nr:rhodanese-like domain-containing protein [Coriobacteriia bacterium]